MYDLPHTPSTSEEIHQKVTQISANFQAKIQQLKPKDLHIFLFEHRKSYGSSVRVLVYWKDGKTQKGWNAMQDTVVKCKKDVDLLHLEAFLLSQVESYSTQA